MGIQVPPYWKKLSMLQSFLVSSISLEQDEIGKEYDQFLRK